MQNFLRFVFISHRFGANFLMVFPVWRLVGLDNTCFKNVAKPLSNNDKKTKTASKFYNSEKWVARFS